MFCYHPVVRAVNCFPAIAFYLHPEPAHLLFGTPLNTQHFTVFLDHYTHPSRTYSRLKYSCTGMSLSVCRCGVSKYDRHHMVRSLAMARAVEDSELSGIRNMRPAWSLLSRTSLMRLTRPSKRLRRPTRRASHPRSKRLLHDRMQSHSPNSSQANPRAKALARKIGLDL
jgi:hypothetical protein